MCSEFARPPAVSDSLVNAWRTRTLERLLERFPPEHAGRLLDKVENHLRDLSVTLHGLHGTPHLGNMADPTDEFVYIVLSRKTAERAYAPAFRRLKEFGSWAAIMDLPEDRVVNLIHGSGLESKKASAIIAGLRTITARFGKPDLSLAVRLEDPDLFDLLAGLPEIGPKSALCVMLYAFRRPVFPVDAHVGRILARLGVFRPWDIDLRSLDHRQRQRVLIDVVPPDLRYPLHVNLIQHGRLTCTATSPSCSECALSTMCESFRDPDDGAGEPR